MNDLLDLIVWQSVILTKARERAKRSHEALITDVDSILPDGHQLIVRAKRINLPNGREDRNKVTQRSWKAHRKTQYK